MLLRNIIKTKEKFPRDIITSNTGFGSAYGVQTPKSTTRDET